MAEKRVSVRLVAEGGRQVRAELEGIGDAGARGFGRLSTEMELANTRLASFARKAGIALAAVTVAAAAAGVAMVRSGLETIGAQVDMAASLKTTVESLQALTWAGELAGVSMGEIEQATKKLTTRLSEAAVETAAGVWEVIQAGAAELIAPGRYRLTRLLRGQRGTEHAMGNPAPAGARVVMLDATLPIAAADLGLPWNWRVGPAARSVTDDSYAAVGFTPTGRGLVPFAPVHVGQPWRIARSPGDLTIRWTRRSRAVVADAWEQVEVPLAEDVEGYDVQILDGAAVKRTLTSSTTSVIYTSAQQTADWGAPRGPGQTLSIRIYHLSNRLGRGTPAVVTLQF